MDLKLWSTWRTLVLSYLVLCRNAEAGIVSFDSDPHHHYSDQQHDDLHDQHVSVASSFMHFHGPVEGPEYEVKVPYVIHHSSENNHLLHESRANDEHSDEIKEHEFHHGYTVDYVAHPKYQFSYGVEDHHTGDFHSQKETRDGSSVSGEYSVMEPSGNVRVVTYHADKDGFHAVVHTTGKNDHSGASYTADASQEHQGHQYPHQVETQDHSEEVSNDEGLHAYVAAYGTHEEYN